MIGQDDETSHVGPRSDLDAGLAPGARVGEYVVKDRIARGGHGAVYEAEHRLLGRRAAIKVMHDHLVDSHEMVARFFREARLVNQIGHPCIVDIYDIGELSTGQPYCVMEFLTGRSLSAVIQAQGRLEPRVAVAVLEQVCGALSAAHAAGVVHRDVKAGNVMVGEGDPPRVKLLDFGIAKVTDVGAEGLTRAGQRLGTYSYMSPEQLQCRPVDARTDVYATGVVLYQMLTGRLPYVGASAEEVERMHLEAPAPRPSLRAPVPAAFDAIVARCLAKSPDERYPSAHALAAALRQAAGLSGPEGARAASAIHVSFASEAADDDAMAAQAGALEAVESLLRENGFAVPLLTANALLALRLLPEAPDAAGALRAEVLALARRLPAAGLESTGVADLVVWVHAGWATIEGQEIVGGEVCRPESWAVAALPGVHATPAASSAG